jgi:hypothetical protein
VRRFLLLSCLLASACGPAADAATSFAVRDSAGVRIVDYAAVLPAGPTVDVSDRPVYRVGDEPGEPEWRSLSWGTLLPDGGAVVTDGGSRVVWIGADGTLRSTLATAGAGPTEVKFVFGIRALGQDTILVQDMGNQKVLLFERGQLARSIPMPAQLGIVSMLGVARPRTLLMATAGFRQLVDPWLEGDLVRLDLDDPRPDTVGRFDFFAYQPRGGPTDPFPAHGWVVTSGESFVTARSDNPELVWRTADGKVKQIVRWNPTRATPTDADLKAYVDSSVALMPRSNPGMSKEQAEQMMARQNFQLSGRPLPVIGLLQGDGEGGVWVSDYALPTPTFGYRRWSLIGSDGAARGSLTLPDRFRLMDVRNDRALGVVYDTLDVQSLAVYQLKRGAARAP